MEISGRVLREVEFRDRLRGYDTDEVDEFLEKIAVAVDELIAELAAAREKLAHHPDPSVDDESLRRTLVLAQRTADLAVREAREEAAALVEDARLEAGARTAEAREEAGRLREEAEQEAHASIVALEERRAALEREIEELGRFVSAEQARLTAALESLSGTPGGDRGSSSEATSPVEDPDETAAPEIRAEEAEEEGGPEVETPAVSRPRAAERPRYRNRAARPEVADVEDDLEDEAEPAGGGRSRPTDEPTLRAVDLTNDGDPDEELWQRWARGADLDAVPKNRGQAIRSTPRRTEHRGGGWSA